jgi:hypothetical protein
MAVQAVLQVAAQVALQVNALHDVTSTLKGIILKGT